MTPAGADGLPPLPDDERMVLGTRRLELLPLVAEHAALLFPVLDDPALHEFTGGEVPASADALRQTYARRAGRRSPDGSRLWLNWLLRRRADGAAVGFIQATVAPDHAQVAWVVGSSWQGRGLASEAAATLVTWLLEELAVGEVRACIHPGHGASRLVAERAGLRRTDDQVDGEDVWVRGSP